MIIMRTAAKVAAKLAAESSRIKKRKQLNSRGQHSGPAQPELPLAPGFSPPILKTKGGTKQFMRFIKRIQIENFQSHIKATIEPAPPGQLTVITGPSDSGKTAVLRAGRWLFVNEPQGDDFIRVGATFARVTAEYESVDEGGGNSGENGGVVVRHRTAGGTNRYIVNGEKLEGFGRGGVPLEVKEITGVRPVKIGDLEFNLNIAEQLSGPFLGSSVSAPARAKVLGKLAGTEEIDYANRLLGTDLHRRNQDEKRLESELKGLEEKVKEYDWLPEAKAKIEVLERLAERIKKVQGRRDKLATLGESIRHVNENIVENQAILYRWRGLAQAEEALTEATEYRHTRETLLFLTDRYWTYEKSVLSCNKVIEKHATLPKAEKKLTIVANNQDRKEKLISLANRYRIQDQGVKDCQEIIAQHASLQGAEEKMLAAQAAAERVARLKLLRINYRTGATKIYRNQVSLKSLESLDTAEGLLRGADAKKQRLELLERLSIKWMAENAAVVGTQKQIENLASLDKAEEKTTKIIETQASWSRLSVLRDRHSEISNKIDNARGQVIVWENRVAELEGAYHDLLEDVGVCPLCGQEIKSKVKEAV
jgi:exonuclease SbcC